jgi:fused signal recognition particle receptor
MKERGPGLLWGGIGKRLRELLGVQGLGAEFFNELEDAMIEADMGVNTAAQIVENLKQEVTDNRIGSREAAVVSLREIVRRFVRSSEVEVPPDKLTLLLVLGVNGVGKTTTIAKLASYFRRVRGIDGILLAAGDTFRAAAIEQLKLHASRLGLPIVAQRPGADPGAVVFDAIESARAKDMRLVIADTAGRLHNKEALVKELMKIDKIARSKLSDGCFQRILVLDATIGQNSLPQAEVFHKAVGIDSIVLAKADSTAKGGMVVPICRELGIPFSFIGTGEKMEDISVFDADRYLDSLFGAL